MCVCVCVCVCVMNDVTTLFYNIVSAKINTGTQFSWKSIGVSIGVSAMQTTW